MDPALFATHYIAAVFGFAIGYVVSRIIAAGANE